MAKKKKNIKIEKFSPFTFLVIVSVLGSLIIAKIIIAQFHEYIPQTNFYGESGLIKEPKEIIDWIIEENAPVRFQLQSHKYIWEPEKKGV